ncbi:unnamed protein product [Phytophthora fragariaefolia]|uniref:Unnamed protein product n=1 Tax=Phytophthora fragariaefolia TaxID=1490495 RepID=A0A9W6XAX6_9STRA|nr:unnamed protein product [Phytophthora fragariaefolia]
MPTRVTFHSVFWVSQGYRLFRKRTKISWILAPYPGYCTRDGSVKEPPKGSERDSVSGSLGVSNSDASTSASVGDAVKVEPPAVDATVEASQPVRDVVTLEDNSNEESIQLTLKDEGPLPTVEEESVPANTNDALRLRSGLARPRLIQEYAQRLSPEVPDTSATRVVVDLTEVADPDPQVQVGEVTVAQAMAYVADQVRRWERVTLGFVASPTIGYSWPSPVPDFRPWWAAMMATSEYVASRMSLANPNDAWISEWNLVRLAPSTAADVTGTMVPRSSLSPRACAALSQTLFFEAGFRFRNLIPGWFHARASQVDPSFVHTVAQDLQQLLAVELLERRDLGSGVSSRIVPALSDRASSDDVKFEKSWMDIAMTDYEAGLLGRECFHRMRMAGVRATRSPAGSALGKPELKHSHLFGTMIADSDESNFSGVSGSQSSGKYSLSSSSMWTFGGAPAGVHMPYAGVHRLNRPPKGSPSKSESVTRSGFTNFVRPSNPACDGSRKGLDGRDRRAGDEQGHKYGRSPRWCPEGGGLMPFRTMGILNPR